MERGREPIRRQPPQLRYAVAVVRRFGPVGGVRRGTVRPRLAGACAVAQPNAELAHDLTQKGPLPLRPCQPAHL